MVKKSYSRVECFKQCPYKYKLKYVDEIKTLPNYDADNALHIGTMLHKAIETDSGFYGGDMLENIRVDS